MAAAFQGKCPFSGMAEEFKMRPQEPKYLRLKNWIESTQAVDTLHQKATNVSEIASHDKFLLQKKKKKNLIYTLVQNGIHFVILLYPCKLALFASSACAKYKRIFKR